MTTIYLWLYKLYRWWMADMGFVDGEQRLPSTIVWGVYVPVYVIWLAMALGMITIGMGTIVHAQVTGVYSNSGQYSAVLVVSIGIIAVGALALLPLVFSVRRFRLAQRQPGFPWRAYLEPFAWVVFFVTVFCIGLLLWIMFGSRTA